MERYSVKLENFFQDDRTGVFARIANLRVTGQSAEGLLKVSRHNIESFSNMSSPINEVYIQLTFERINEIDSDNEKRNRFINRYLRPKIRTNKINVPLIEIGIDKTPTEQMMEQISGFVVDIIYNHPHIHIVVPPKITMPKDIHPTVKETTFQRQIVILLETLRSFSDRAQLAYFVPDYIPRVAIPRLIDFYVNNCGDEALLIVDMDGKRFSAGGYSDVSLIHRVMYSMNIEDYAIYLFNHKGRKRSGKAVPSEDLLALLGGASFVGPTHKVLPLPREVLERVRGLSGKIFNKEDFLFYPEKIAPNIEEFEEFSRIGRNRRRLLEIFNDINLNMCAYELTEDPISSISNLTRHEFKETLKTIAKKRNTILRQQTLVDLI